MCVWGGGNIYIVPAVRVNYGMLFALYTHKEDLSDCVGKLEVFYAQTLEKLEEHIAFGSSVLP